MGKIESIAMIKAVTFLCSFLLSQFTFSQLSGSIPSTSAIAQTSVSDSRHWTAFHNPALLGAVKKTELALQYENRFQLSELATKTVQAAIPHSLINTGISCAQFGSPHYQEWLVGCGWGRNFGDKFSMGVQFNYFTSYFEASNRYRSAILAQCGLMAHLSPNFSLGFASFNPFQSNIQAELVVQRLPSLFSIGTEYFVSSDLRWRVQLDKELSTGYRFASGIDYVVLQIITIKLGVYQAHYLIPCLGLGVKTAAYGLSFSTELHPLLGLTPNVGLHYQL